MSSITIKAPAKVNTLLRVLGRREDGFHDLEMVMVPLTLADEIELKAIPSGIEFSLKGDGDQGMIGDKNLSFRAAAKFREATGVNLGVHIHLDKKIPIAAGLGGGSSDAAAVLKGLNLLWNVNWPASKLASLGAKLGADVPFFCYDKPAFVEGIGDIITPYNKFPNLALLLINPGFAVSTPWVYKQWDLHCARREIEGLTPKLLNARVRPLFKVFSDVAESLHNDLETVTVPAYPEIAKIKKVLIDAGAAGAMMSGSGPTVFAVFEHVCARDKAIVKIKNENGWRVMAAENIV